MNVVDVTLASDQYVDSLMQHYHFASSDCDITSCPGVRECCYAENVSRAGVIAAAKAAETHLAHQLASRVTSLQGSTGRLTEAVRHLKVVRS